MKREVIIPVALEKLIEGVLDKSNSYTVRRNFYDRLTDIQSVIHDAIKQYDNEERDSGGGW